jgi:arylformamidase
MPSAILKIGSKSYSLDMAKGIDISLPVSRDQGPNAFYLQHAEFNTVEAGRFVGNVRRGGSCNVEDISFSPHGNGTHTECAGHIAPEPIYIKDILPDALLTARLISVTPVNGVIGAGELSQKIGANAEKAKALIVRTLPNDEGKRRKNYSGENPTYFHAEAIHDINEAGIEHLLTDLPSLDKVDDSKLLAHHAFFREGENWNKKKTVTEMVFVPDEIPDGLYALNLQMAAFESDACPSKPVLFFLTPE